MQQSTTKNLTLVSSSQIGAHPRSFLPCSLPQRHTQHARSIVQARAQQQQQQQQKPEVAKFADSVGLPTEEGLFGFKPFPEVRQHLDATSTCSLNICRLMGTVCMPELANKQLSQRWFSPICMEQVGCVRGILFMFARYSFRWHPH